MNIVLLSAYHAQSHAYWAEQLKRAMPQWHWHELSLSPRHFNWRIRGNPLSWWQSETPAPDLLVATSMVDLATLRGLRSDWAQVPALVYFHENQFAYPQGQGSHRRLEPLMVNLYSALSADRLCFNSDYNRDSFLHGVRQFLKQMPDAVDVDRVCEQLSLRSQVLPVPVSPASATGHARKAMTDRSADSSPIVLWNHRWEYDKGPDHLLALVRAFHEQGESVRWAIVGQQFRKRPSAFETIAAMAEAKEIELYRWSYVESQADYQRLLTEADVVLSTALHDFQGLAVQEAVLAGCCPLVPDRLAYPQWFESDYRYTSSPDDPAIEAASALAKYRLLKQAGWPAVNLSFLSNEGLREQWRTTLLDTVANGRL